VVDFAGDTSLKSLAQENQWGRGDDLWARSNEKAADQLGGPKTGAQPKRSQKLKKITSHTPISTKGKTKRKHVHLGRGKQSGGLQRLEEEEGGSERRIEKKKVTIAKLG